jgi:adenosylhomocysteine nucleosidase
MLTIIAAMEQELAGIRRALRVRGLMSCALGAHPRPLSLWEGGDQESPPLTKGNLGGFPEVGVGELDLQVVGIGKERAQASIKRLLASRQRPGQDGLLLLGFAGGIDPSLKSGDLVLSNRYCWVDGVVSPFGKGGRRGISPSATGKQRDFLEPDSNLWQQAIEAARAAGLSVSQGSSLTVDQAIATPEAKKEVYLQRQVATVNMEDYWAAEAAAESGAPFLAVRAVLDPAHQGLPSYLIGLSERQAQVVLRRVLTKPWRAPILLRLAQQARVAQGSLTRFALAFIDHQLSAREGQPAARQ